MQVRDTNGIFIEESVRRNVIERVRVSKYPVDLAIAWEVLLVYDIVIFTLTVVKSWRTRLRRDRPFEFSRSSVLDLIVRDGAHYGCLRDVLKLTLL